jgi:DNA-binding MarR family transcriptional regulator
MNRTRAELMQRLIDMMSRSSFELRGADQLEWPQIELTMPQLRTLVFLRGSPRRMSDVAAMLGIGLSSATSMIERLESKGLVQRIHDPHDRRVVRCQLSDQGTAELERFWRVQASKMQAVADLLSHDELAKVVEAMEILVAAIVRHEQAIDPTPSEPPNTSQGVDL